MPVRIGCETTGTDGSSGLCRKLMGKWEITEVKGLSVKSLNPTWMDFKADGELVKRPLSCERSESCSLNGNMLTNVVPANQDDPSGTTVAFVCEIISLAGDRMEVNDGGIGKSVLKRR